MKLDVNAPRSRRVVRRTTHRVVGRFPSLKAGRIIHWESQLERDMARLLEFDPSVVRYAEQPESLEYVEHGKKRSYTPDFLIEARTGQMILEIKPYDQATTEPWKSRLALFEQLYCDRSMPYFVMTEREIQREPRLSNVTMLLRYQRQPIPVRERDTVLDALEGGPMTLGSLRRHLREAGIDETYAYTLATHGLLTVDLDAPIGPDTQICKTPVGTS